MVELNTCRPLPEELTIKSPVPDSVPSNRMSLVPVMLTVSEPPIPPIFVTDPKPDTPATVSELPLKSSVASRATATCEALGITLLAPACSVPSATLVEPL